MKLLQAIVVLGLAVTPAMAPADQEERAPTAEERTRILQALELLGYTSVGKIEIEHDEIEVDDALHTDGHRYELKLDPQSLKLIGRERDDN